MNTSTHRDEMNVSTHRDGQTLVVELLGSWDLEDDVPSSGSVTQEMESATAIDCLDVRGDDLQDWDTSLLVFLLDVVEAAEAREWNVNLDALPGDARRLLEMARAVPERDVERDRPPDTWTEAAGTQVIDLWDGTKHFVQFTGQIVESAWLVARGRSTMRWRDFWWVLQNSSAKALGIVTLIAFLVGLILSFLGAVVLRRFGADYYVSYLISYGMLRELGALMTAIIMAGRTGAAFAAELGSMKISEEIDALKTLGLSPIDVLVLPRVVAIFAAMPLLAIYANFVGILGGWLVAVQMLDVTTPQFFTGLVAPVAMGDATLGVVKATVFGAIIGITGCLRGMRAGNDAAAVGDAATSAVVTGITLIVLANAIIDWMAALLNV